MNQILAAGFQEIENSLVVVCEGSGDARFIYELMNALGIAGCSVGYPNEKDAQAGGKDAIGAYLRAIKNWFIVHPEKTLDGIAIVLDTDDNPQSAIRLACKALLDAGFPSPGRAYSLDKTEGVSVAVYLIPGVNLDGEPATGTLEDLLLNAAFARNPQFQGCLDTFIGCVGKAPLDKPNKLAKMRLSSLVGAAFHPNPWASVDKLLASSKSGDLIPLDSPHFKHLGDFLTKFCTL